MYSCDLADILTNSDNTTNDGPKERLSLPLAVVYTIIACLAVLGNGMVITVMLLRRRVFSSFTNRLILHQSVIDSIAGVVFFLWRVLLEIIPQRVSYVDDIAHQLYCQLIVAEVPVWCMNLTSTYHLVVLSLERFMATCHPVKHRNMWTSFKLKCAMGAAWTIGALYSFYLAFVLEVKDGNCQPKEYEIGLKVFEASAVVTVEYLIPVTFLFYTYVRITIKLTKQSSNQINGPRSAMTKTKKNVLVTAMLIGIMFVLCWTPIEVLFVHLQLSGDWASPLYGVFTCLVACNMLVNPVIYCMKYEKFRSELRKLVLQRYRRNRVQDGNPIAMTAASSRMNTN